MALDRALGPVMIDVASLALAPDERELLGHPLVGGVILFTRNYQSPAQLGALTASIHALRDPPLMIAVDLGLGWLVIDSDNAGGTRGISWAGLSAGRAPTLISQISSWSRSDGFETGVLGRKIEFDEPADIRLAEASQHQGAWRESQMTMGGGTRGT